jgi:hypothetical protein
VRSDGTEKPAADVIRKFSRRRNADTQPTSIPGILDVGADEYYKSPQAHFDRLYAAWLSGIQS